MTRAAALGAGVLLLASWRPAAAARPVVSIEHGGGASDGAPPAAPPIAAQRIQVEVRSGPWRRIVAAGQVAVIPLESGMIKVVVRLPHPVDSAAAAVEVTAAAEDIGAPGPWQAVTRTSSASPAGDTLAFALRGASPATLTVRVTPAPGGDSLQFGVRITELPVLTLADAGQTVRLAPGERFLVALGTRAQWGVEIGDRTVIDRAAAGPDADGGPGVPPGVQPGHEAYEAKGPGRTLLRFVGLATCRHPELSCVALEGLEADVQFVVG